MWSVEYHGVCNDILTTSFVFCPSHHQPPCQCNDRMFRPPVDIFISGLSAQISIVSSHLLFYQDDTHWSHWSRCTLRPRYCWGRTAGVVTVCLLLSSGAPLYPSYSWSWSIFILTPGWLQLSHSAMITSHTVRNQTHDLTQPVSALINWSHINLAGYW